MTAATMPRVGSIVHKAMETLREHGAAMPRAMLAERIGYDDAEVDDLLRYGVRIELLQRSIDVGVVKYRLAPPAPPGRAAQVALDEMPPAAAEVAAPRVLRAVAAPEPAPAPQPPAAAPEAAAPPAAPPRPAAKRVVSAPKPKPPVLQPEELQVLTQALQAPAPAPKLEQDRPPQSLRIAREFCVDACAELLSLIDCEIARAEATAARLRARRLSLARMVQ